LDFEILGGRFSPIGDFVVFDGLALIEAAEAGFLDCGDMDEHVLSAAALRLNKPVPLLGIEPLHRAARHIPTPCLRLRLASRTRHDNANNRMSVWAAVEDWMGPTLVTAAAPGTNHQPMSKSKSSWAIAAYAVWRIMR
jgi:hypothetical protein